MPDNTLQKHGILYITHVLYSITYWFGSVTTIPRAIFAEHWTRNLLHLRWEQRHPRNTLKWFFSLFLNCRLLSFPFSWITFLLLILSQIRREFFLLDYISFTRIPKCGDREKNEMGLKYDAVCDKSLKTKKFLTCIIWIHFLPVHEVLVVTWFFCWNSKI